LEFDPLSVCEHISLCFSGWLRLRTSLSDLVSLLNAHGITIFGQVRGDDW
jgi:hypothetical protein